MSLEFIGQSINYYTNLKVKFAKSHAKFLPSLLRRALYTLSKLKNALIHSSAVLLLFRTFPIGFVLPPTVPFV